jgi:hypothetical protein
MGLGVLLIVVVFTITILNNQWIFEQSGQSDKQLRTASSKTTLTPYCKRFIKSCNTVLSTLEAEHQFTSDQLEQVQMKMDWVIEPILEKYPDNEKIISEQAGTCWQSLLEAIQHKTTKKYTKDVMSIPYYQALKYTNMRVNDAIGEILGIIYPKYVVNAETPPGLLGPFDPAEAKRALKNMNTQGYHILSTKLSPDVLKEIAANLASLKYGADGKTKFDGEKRDGSVNWVTDPLETTQKVKVSFAMMTDPTLLHIIQEYLGDAPVNTQVNTWWSTACNKLLGCGGAKEGSQAWHQDFTWIKFIKIFVYVNDVYKENGAHRYIPGSYKNLFPVLEFRKDNYEVSTRIEDSDIQQLYPGKETYMEGTAGTILLEDTRGFHAGVPLQKGYRQLMQWEFAVSNYRYLNDAWFSQHTCKSWFEVETINNFQKYPRLFERFEVDASC